MKVLSITNAFLKITESGVNSIIIDVDSGGVTIDDKLLLEKLEGCQNVVFYSGIVEQKKEISSLVKKYNKKETTGRVFIIVNGDNKPTKITGNNLHLLYIVDLQNKNMDIENFIKYGYTFILLGLTQDQFDKAEMFITANGILKKDIYFLTDEDSPLDEIKLKGYNITDKRLWI